MVDIENKTPFYYQIKQDIEKRIKSGELKENQKIDSENVLTEKYGVSRPTVRKALDELVYEGTLWRRQGKGTFVAPFKIKRNLMILSPFSQTVQSMGKMPRIKVLEKREIYASAQMAKDLEVEENSPIYEVISLNIVEDTVMGIKTFHYPAAMFPGILELFQDNVAAFNLIENYLTEHYQMHIYKSARSFCVVEATDQESQVLGVKKKAPLILWEGVMYSDKGVPYEHFKELYRADKYTFYVEEYRDFGEK